MTTKILLISLIALSAIEHDGVRYGPNEDAGADMPEMPKAQAQPLIDCGAAELAPVDKPGEALAPVAKTIPKK